MRKFALPLLLGGLLAAGLQPATAATTPAKVGLVSFVAASYSRTHDTAGFTLDWDKSSGAKSYEVFMSRSYSMSSAKKYRASISEITIKGLTPDRDYFFQVRGVNGKKTGSKSSRVGHRTTAQPGPKGELMPLRVMTFNVCSDVCDEIPSGKTKPPTPYPWKPVEGSSRAPRQPAAFERIAAASPDVLATQEAGYLDTPPGYTLARSMSAKRLFFKTDRFELVPGTTTKAPARDKNGCVADTSYTDPTGHIFLGRHSKGCRYAVWAKLTEIETGRTVLAVDVHLVTGTSSGAVANRQVEVSKLVASVAKINTTRLPVVYAGDFNSHKGRSSDVVGATMRSAGFLDGYDLARSLFRQHNSSYQGFHTTPTISVKWGDHVDHVYVDPRRSRVDQWLNAVNIVDGRVVKPQASDHSPVIVDVAVR